MKGLKDFLNESIGSSDSKLLINLLSKAVKNDSTRPYDFYKVTFNDIDDNNGFIIAEKDLSQNANNYFHQFLDRKRLVQNYEQIKHKETEANLKNYLKSPSFYCCRVTFKDPNKTNGFIFSFIDEKDVESFERWLSYECSMVDGLYT